MGDEDGAHERSQSITAPFVTMIRVRHNECHLSKYSLTMANLGLEKSTALRRWCPDSTDWEDGHSDDVVDVRSACALLVRLPNVRICGDFDRELRGVESMMPSDDWPLAANVGYGEVPKAYAGSSNITTTSVASGHTGRRTASSGMDDRGEGSSRMGEQREAAATAAEKRKRSDALSNRRKSSRPAGPDDEVVFVE